MRLKYQDHLTFVAAIGGAAILAWDGWRSVRLIVPDVGWVGYLTGAIFTHKVSEFVVGFAWILVAFGINHEREGRWPKRWSRERHYAALRVLRPIVLIATVLATYAWTIVNFGTSEMTTNAAPLAIGPVFSVIAWRYYLGALVVAGAVFVLFRLPVERGAPRP